MEVLTDDWKGCVEQEYHSEQAGRTWRRQVRYKIKWRRGINR